MVTQNLILKIVSPFFILTGIILWSVFLIQLNAIPECLSVTGDGTTSLDGLMIDEYVNSIPDDFMQSRKFRNGNENNVSLILTFSLLEE